jgi:hypothetical protein
MEDGGYELLGDVRGLRRWIRLFPARGVRRKSLRAWENGWFIRSRLWLALSTVQSTLYWMMIALRIWCLRVICMMAYDWVWVWCLDGIEGGCIVVFILLPFFLVFPLLHHRRCYHHSIVLCSHPSVLMSCPLSRFTPNTGNFPCNKAKTGEYTTNQTPKLLCYTHFKTWSIQSHLSAAHKPVARTSQLFLPSCHQPLQRNSP